MPPAPAAPQLALAMLARSDAAGLRRAVASVRDVVDEIVIAVDGRSDQETWEAAQDLGTTAFRFAWDDIAMSEEDWNADKFHFANARNLLFAHVKAPWVVQLDSDEWISAGADKLRGLTTRDESIGAYNLQIEQGGLTNSITRLLRRSAGTWEMATHNQFCLTDDFFLAATRDVVITHDTSLRSTERQEARDRQRDDGARSLQQQADAGVMPALYHLAKHLIGVKDIPGALHYTTEYRLRAHPHGQDSSRRFWLALGMAWVYLEVEDVEQAELWALRALLDGPRVEAFCILGDLAEMRGQLNDAAVWYDAACALPETSGNSMPGLTEHRYNRRAGIYRALRGAERVEPPAAPLPPRSAPPSVEVVIGVAYKEAPTPERAEELRQALDANLANPAVTAVHLLTAEELPEPLHMTHAKLRVERVPSVRFIDLFAYASRELSGKLCAILNADMAFAPGSVEMIPELDKTVLCLSRWERTGAFQGQSFSQSAWVFESPLEIPDATYSPWENGCDNRLAYDLHQAKRHPWNPSRSIRVEHFHATEERPTIRRRSKVLPPYAVLPPVALDLPSRAPALPDAVALLTRFSAWIETAQPFAFSKWGDGELSFIGSAPVPNVDGQEYSVGLSNALRHAFTFMCEHPYSYIAKWEKRFSDVRDLLVHTWQYRPNYTFYDALLLREGALTPELLQFYRTLRDTRRPKVFVGPTKLAGVADLLRTDAQITVPPRNAAGDFVRLDHELRDHVRAWREPGIVLFSAGMLSKLLIHELLRFHPDATCLDLGSAFDPAFIGQTRSGQPTQAEAQDFIAEL